MVAMESLFMRTRIRLALPVLAVVLTTVLGQASTAAEERDRAEVGSWVVYAWFDGDSFVHCTMEAANQDGVVFSLSSEGTFLSAAIDGPDLGPAPTERFALSVQFDETRFDDPSADVAAAAGITLVRTRVFEEPDARVAFARSSRLVFTGADGLDEAFSVTETAAAIQGIYDCLERHIG